MSVFLMGHEFRRMTVRDRVFFQGADESSLICYCDLPLQNVVLVATLIGGGDTEDDNLWQVEEINTSIGTRRVWTVTG